MSESLKQQIDHLEELCDSSLDPQGRAFVPLADAHLRMGALDRALAVVREGLVRHPDFASAHMVAGWVHRARRESDEAMHAFERVLELDSENALARAAIAELVDDQRAQAYRAKVAAQESVEQAGGAEDRPIVPIGSLASGADRPVVSIASLSPMASVDADPPAFVPASAVPPPALPEPLTDDVPTVPIAYLAPDVAVERVGTPVAPAPSVVPVPPPVLEDEGSPVVPAPSSAPMSGPEDVGGAVEIYTETLAELYAGQGATEKAIETYRKLLEGDPENGAFLKRMAELESVEPGSAGVPAPLDLAPGLGSALAALGERPTVPIETLAPDGP